MNLAARLKQRRLAYGKAAGLAEGYTQQQLAEVAGVSQGRYCAYEAGGRYADRATRPPLMRMLKICRFYGASLQDAFPEYRPTLAEREELEAMRSHLAGV